MRRTIRALLLPGIALLSTSVRADLKIDITRGVTDPVPVAVVPFARAVPADGGLDIAAVVQRDLESSGRFRGIDRTAMPSRPTRSGEVDATAWRAQRADYVVVGRVAADAGGSVQLQFELVNVLTGQVLLNETV